MYRQEASVEGLPFPTDIPESMRPSRVDPVKFDPKVHLQLQIPEGIKMLLNGDPNFCDECAFPAPLAGSADNPGLAYTKPFRVLSQDGVRALREVIFANENRSCHNERAPKFLRGLGYVSDFARDFTYCPEVIEHLSKCAGLDLWPHDLHMNVGHVNFGQVGESRPVDTWHLDSVPYVMVLLLSDGNDMVGGELQVARIADAADALRQVQSNSVSPEDIDTVRYPDAGYAILMQGSRIAHCVTPVEFAREPRLTLVNCYQSLDPFVPSKTLYHYFKHTDPEDVHPSEITRHFAWRAQGQLQKLIRNPMWGDTESIQQLLKNAAEELQYARALVTGETEEEAPYAVDKSKELVAPWRKTKTPVAKL
eukprot:TRINITY_DN1026_c0_g1_i2.p1 TRINITY_DN1026_c0_g1~~TRINITY_DN1026_c0_g1_i2.p1  ORF type:complete len:365 (+),score=33.31 TRINITY_DN1026_c0_g1_i2:104-1198(+)